MQIAFGVFAWVFLRVRRKTEPTGSGSETVIFSKIDTYDRERNSLLQQVHDKTFGRSRAKLAPTASWGQDFA